MRVECYVESANIIYNNSYFLAPNFSMHDTHYALIPCSIQHCFEVVLWNISQIRQSSGEAC